ncbi:hypothetical protein NE237_022397 [Protea cynaroides]|uniref:BZIP domain-containing protein n=1 Tax=Protea cynaroides TaxID=273540 RepID=A0A9Q0HAB3_9MAGN|nr:hypothetical protein NE237_022397 [Protea cynaroides]
MSVPAPAAMLASQGLLDLPFPVFEGDFTPWWENEEPMSLIQPHHQSLSPVNSNSGSDEPQNRPSVSVVDERKQRRMLSNRESARRSRMRKQKHLEGLRKQVNRHKIENRELVNRLGLVIHHCHLIRRDNDRLRSESVALRQKLSNLHRILLLRQHLFLSSPSPCNSFLPVNEVNEQLPSLIA